MRAHHGAPRGALQSTTAAASRSSPRALGEPRELLAIEEREQRRLRLAHLSPFFMASRISFSVWPPGFF
jgi:hypothetical protein